jgi:hypothetical protein
MKKLIALLFCFATILIGTCAFSADSFDLGLGMSGFAAGQYRAALDRLGPLAEKGDPDAQVVLGLRCRGQID